MAKERNCVVCGKPLPIGARSTTKAHDGECGYQLRNSNRPPRVAKEKATPESLPPDEEHKLRRENKELRRDLSDLRDAQFKDETLQAFIGQCLALKPSAPKWAAARGGRGGEKKAIATCFLSDTHWGEVVQPAEVEWTNAYNRTIQFERLKNFFSNSIRICDQYIAGIEIEGLVLPLGGDLFSGDIHEELQKTNEGSIQQEILECLSPMIAGILLLADRFGKVFIPAVPGNHPRSTRKPSAKMRAPNNFDWLFYHLLKRELDDDKRITWAISPAADVSYKVYDWRYCLTHGDQFRGGSGIAAEFSPMLLGHHRKSWRAQQTKKPYDYLIMGHWHRRNRLNNIIVNGSVKGADEYAFVSNFPFENPVQSFWLTDPDEGITIEAPIQVLGKNESWMREERDELVAVA